VLAGSQHRDGGIAMQMIRRRNRHGVDGPAGSSVLVVHAQPDRSAVVRARSWSRSQIIATVQRGCVVNARA
jgi:hypothetical protein